MTGAGSWAGKLVALPLAYVTAALEVVMSPRGLAILFLALASLLTSSGWLRPPLSPDISSLYVPLGILSGHGPSAEDILEGPRKIPWDSAGVLLLATIAVATALVLWRPERLGLAAGVLLAAAIVANAAAALNHPALVERMEDELDQHHHIVAGLLQTCEHPLATFKNGRIVEHAGPSGEQDPSLTGGLAFLHYGIWLVILATAGVLYGGRGPLRRRLVGLLGWSSLGITISGVLCGPRLCAEWNFERARLAELRGDYSEARSALERSVSWLPELGRLECTWLLQGKLDYEAASASPQSRFWQASQYARNGRIPMASGLLDDLRRKTGESYVVRRLAAKLWTMRGNGRLARADLGGAEEHYRKAIEVQPRRFDGPFLLGIARARADRHDPELTEAAFAPFLGRCADPQLCADALNAIGDAYFDAGAIQEARDRYAESFRVFNLLTNMNLRAQKGLGGL
jgi:tetratricopeptide (TPR) repeat protein